MPPTVSPNSYAAQKLRARLEAEIVDEDLALPQLPDAAAQVLAACNSEECDARGLAEVISRDPSLTAQVLRVANSAAYAPEEPIVSVQQAVSRLGVGTLCGIAMTVVTQGQVFQLPGHEARLVDLWRHSALTAAWAREIARFRRRNVEGAFLAALLHDLGEPIVLEAVIGIEELTGMNLGEELIDEWIEEFHTGVGQRLLAAWKLPSWVAEAARHHHDPDQALEHLDEVRTVRLADLLARATDSGQACDLDAVRCSGALESLGLYVDELDELLERTEAVEELAEVFR